MNKKIILFDIDYTLFNPARYRELATKLIAEKVPHTENKNIQQMVDKIVLETRQIKYFDYPKQFAQLFTKHYPNTLSEKFLEEIWWQEEILQRALFPEAIDVVRQLQKKTDVHLGIFSSGKTEFQLAKISGLEDFFQQKHIHIAFPKEETLEELLRGYKFYNIIFVDDYIDILYKAKSMRLDVNTVWIKRGRYADKAVKPDGFEPDATILNLNELLPIVDSIWQV